MAWINSKWGRKWPKLREKQDKKLRMHLLYKMWQDLCIQGKYSIGHRVLLCLYFISIFNGYSHLRLYKLITIYNVKHPFNQWYKYDAKPINLQCQFKFVEYINILTQKFLSYKIMRNKYIQPSFNQNLLELDF